MQASRQETVQYLATLTKEMLKLAEAAGLDAIVYLFQMALIEAETHGAQERKKQAA